MPPRTLFLRPSAMRITPRPIYHPALLKYYSTKQPPPPNNPPPKTPAGPNQDVLPHASEEAAATAEIMGQTKPEIEQGTPIGEMINRSPEAKKKAPDVLKGPSSKRSYSTLVTPSDTPGDVPGDVPSDISATIPVEPSEAEAVETADAASSSLFAPPPLPPGAKFALPELPIPARAHMQYRYSPLVEQVTNFLMRHGKKATAQSNVLKILNILRTKPAPKPNLQSPPPLIPGTPALSSLPSDPIGYLQTAIDSVAPLVKIISVKGAGGTKDMIPSPLNIRQRRRTALVWISDAADKRSDKNRLAERFADEIVAVVEGRSGAWDRRTQIHKQAILARANVSTQPKRKGKNTLKFPYN